MKRFAAVVLSLFLFACCLPLSAGAAAGFAPKLSETEGREGDAVEISIPYDGSLGRVGVFQVRVEFAPNTFRYQKFRESSEMREAYSFVMPKEDEIRACYVHKKSKPSLDAACDTYTFRFHVADGAPEGEAFFRVSVYDICDPDAAPYSSVDVTLPFTVLPPASQDATLVSLRPSAGQLVPAFSPDCCDYEVTVPFSEKTLTFLARPAEGAVCKVNRKNLGAGGSDTDFLLTVTAEDGRTKTVYKVTAHREEKPVTVKPTATPKPDPTPKPGKTPKPTATPKPGRSPSPTEEPTASPAESPLVPAETETTPPPPAGGSYSRPAIVIRNGQTSPVPLLICCGLMALASLLSGPFARWYCARFPKEEEPEENEENEKDSKP